MALRPISDDNDQTQITVYDDNGQARFSLQKIGTQAQVNESVYDAAGRVILTRAYADTIDYQDSYTLDALQSTLYTTPQAGLEALSLRDAHDNRTTHVYYDNAGRVRFRLDSDGGVRETRYNALGQVSEQLAYVRAHASTVSERSRLTLADLEADYPIDGTLDDGDRLSFTRYDALGNVTRVIDAQGGTEQWTYDSRGLRTSYTNQAGHTWHYVYDDAGRLSREVRPATQQAVDTNGSYALQ